MSEPVYLQLPRLPEGWTLGSLSQQDDGSWVLEAREGHLTSYNNVFISERRMSPRLAGEEVIDKITKLEKVRNLARQLDIPKGRYWL